VKGQIQMDMVDEATAIFRDSVDPAYKRLNGFHHASRLIDLVTGSSLGLGMWESEADRTAIQSGGAFQEQLGKFAAVQAALPVPDTYEVKV